MNHLTWVNVFLTNFLFSTGSRAPLVLGQWVFQIHDRIKVSPGRLCQERWPYGDLRRQQQRAHQRFWNYQMQKRGFSERVVRQRAETQPHLDQSAMWCWLWSPLHQEGRKGYQYLKDSGSICQKKRWHLRPGHVLSRWDTLAMLLFKVSSISQLVMAQTTVASKLQKLVTNL